MGKIFNKEGNFLEARKYLLKSRDGIYEVYQNANKHEFNYQMYIAEKNLNNPTTALVYLENAYGLNDTLYRVGT